ncbi:MAG: hypothetical protein JWR44_1759 [Hymenobacter sp.]|nr:hypothetical protein [Hymenobacter sp.]
MAPPRSQLPAACFQRPGPSFLLVTAANGKGRGQFRLLFTGSGGRRQRVRREFTKLIYLARFVN